MNDLWLMILTLGGIVLFALVCGLHGRKKPREIKHKTEYCESCRDIRRKSEYYNGEWRCDICGISLTPALLYGCVKCGETYEFENMTGVCDICENEKFTPLETDEGIKKWKELWNKTVKLDPETVWQEMLDQLSLRAAGDKLSELKRRRGA